MHGKQESEGANLQRSLQTEPLVCFAQAIALLRDP